MLIDPTDANDDAIDDKNDTQSVVLVTQEDDKQVKSNNELCK